MFNVFALILLAPFHAQARWVSPDFLIIPAPVSVTAVAGSGDCRAQIAAAVCLVDPPEGNEFGTPRPCLPGSAGYAQNFERLYDHFPAHLQKMFCHIKRIYVEKEFVGSAYAGLYTEAGNEKHVLGGLIGVRKSLLDNPATLDSWASWKEQIHFGTDPSRVTVAPGLPTVQTSLAGGGQTDMLYFLVTHEFGHVFDFTNGLNESGAWTKFSWKNMSDPLDESNFPLRAQLCFYFCNGKYIDASRQDELYESLAKTNFLSAYTTRYATEDFADTLAYYTIMTERNATYRITTASGLVYDAVERLRSDPLLQPKRRFIEEFLGSRYAYPGDTP